MIDLPLLTRVVRATAAGSDPDAVLRRAARELTAVADLVLVDRIDAPDLIVRIAALGPDGPLQLPEELGAPRARRSSAGSAGLLPLLRGTPNQLLRLDSDTLRSLVSAADPRVALQARSLLERGVQDLVIVGVSARETLLGVLTLGSTAGPIRATEESLLDVAAHLATALDAARLLTFQKDVAGALQRSLLPGLPTVPDLSMAARYVPAAVGLEVGGDWYDAFVLGDDLLLAIGDVTGHDLAAATRMAELRSIVRVHAADGHPPAGVLTRTGATAEVLGLDAAATAVVCRLTRSDDASWRLRWSNAGHPPPLVVHAGRASRLEAPAELMLGVQSLSSSAARSDHEVVLHPGDLLVLYTDGLVETRDSDIDTGIERLREQVERLAARGADAMAEELVADLSGTEDDVAVLIAAVRSS